MSDIGTGGRLRADGTWVVWLLCAAVLAAAIPWQMRWGVVADTSWLLTSAERILAGQRLYRDIADTNPPFSTWLYVPPVLLAKMIGLRAETVVCICTYLICLGGLGSAALILRRAKLPEAPALFPMLPFFLALLVLFPGNAFTEREHIGVALFLPLAALAAWRITPEAATETPPVWLAIASGLAAGVIVLVKPYYVVLVLAVAFCVAWRRRDIRLLFAAEYLSAAALSIAYVAAVILVHPEFLTETYPHLADTYMRLVGDWDSMTIYIVLLAAWLVVSALLKLAGGRSVLAEVLSVAALAAYLPLFYQMKGWPYHAYPALALGSGALLCRLAAMPRAGIPRTLSVAVFVIVAAMPFMLTQKPSPELVKAIRAAVVRPTVDMVGSDIAVGHPLNRDIDGRWISAYCSDWLGTALVTLALKAEAEGDTAEARRYGAMRDRFIDDKIATLLREPPQILLVQNSDQYWIDILSRHPGYADLMSGYRLLGQDGPITAYLRAASPAASSD